MSKTAKLALVFLVVAFLLCLLYLAWETFTPGSTAVPTPAPGSK